MDFQGKTIGHITLRERIGEGATSEVWLGYDQKLDRRVAVKAIPRTHRRQRARLLREARLLSRLDHPNICRVFGLVESDEFDFLVLELIHGKSLRKVLAHGLDRDLKMKIARQLADVLVTAHRFGIIHRDLKPENVMLIQADEGPGDEESPHPAEAGRIKVLDFGLARHLEEELSSLSVMGTDVNPFARPEGFHFYMRGTLAYMSPEQVQGDKVTAAADMFALGVLLQELFTGRPAYDFHLEPSQLLLKVTRGDTLPMASGHAELDQLVEELKSPEPARRPNADAVTERLRRADLRTHRRHRRWQIAAAAIVVAMLSAAGLWLHHRLGHAEEALRREMLRSDREVAAAEHFTVVLTEVLRARQGSLPSPAEILDAETRRARAELADEPRIQARHFAMLARAYHALGLHAEAESLLREAAAITAQN